MYQSAEEIANALMQKTAEYKQTIVNNVKTDKADAAQAGQYPLTFRVHNYRVPEIPAELRPLLDEYHSARIYPDIQMARNAILYAVGEVIWEITRGKPSSD